MILINTGVQPRQALVPDPHAGAQLDHAAWIDLHDPSDAERGAVESATGLRIPSKDQLSEIESSSRLASHDGVFTLSTPMVSRVDHAAPVVFPLGFVLTRTRLVTVRYTELRAFDLFAERFHDPEARHTGPAAFVGLLEAIVDRLADVLERVGAELDGQSRAVFRPEIAEGAGGRNADAVLRDVLRSLGRSGEMISNLRDSLLGIARIAGYVVESIEHMPAEAAARLKTLRADVQSLNDYEGQLSNKVSFLLDATLGFINIQQNNIIKVLTVASIAGIPPTLIAGIYGMNFERLPELKWAYGYPYSLALMALSAALPILWFKRRGWL